MCVKVGLCLFLVRFQGSDEDGTEIGARIGARGRCGGGSLRHTSNKILVTVRNSDEMFGSVTSEGIASSSMQMGRKGALTRQTSKALPRVSIGDLE
jgi:hypothetical protein